MSASATRDVWWTARGSEADVRAERATAAAGTGRARQGHASCDGDGGHAVQEATQRLGGDEELAVALGGGGRRAVAGRRRGGEARTGSGVVIARARRRGSGRERGARRGAHGGGRIRAQRSSHLSGVFSGVLRTSTTPF